jgi:hypothetical protein
MSVTDAGFCPLSRMRERAGVRETVRQDFRVEAFAIFPSSHPSPAGEGRSRSVCGCRNGGTA